MLGDVIMATPLPRLLRRENPGVEIDFMTEMTAVFCNNPHVQNILPFGTPIAGDCYSRIIVLDRAYEMRPNMHASQAYALEAFGANRAELAPELFPSSSDSMAASKFLAAISGPYLVIHARHQPTWPSRNLPEEFWHRLIAHITSHTSIHVVVVGDSYDFPLNARSSRVISLVGQLNLHQTYTIIDRACAFVGFDSGLLHVASCTKTPIVGLFSTARPEFRKPLRTPEKFIGILADVPCAGCQHEEPPPVLNYICRRGDNICRDSFSIESVMSALNVLIDC